MRVGDVEGQAWAALELLERRERIGGHRWLRRRRSAGGCSEHPRTGEKEHCRERCMRERGWVSPGVADGRRRRQ
eukprot:scaffold133259_cov112-Phaeocystis_antarctica.AAC.4